MGNVRDLDDFRKKKQAKLEEEKQQKIEDANTDLFIKIITKSVKDLNDEELKVYDEIGLLLQFQLLEKFSMALAVFRHKIYVVNYVGNETFEYLGEFNDVIKRGLGL